MTLPLSGDGPPKAYDLGFLPGDLRAESFVETPCGAQVARVPEATPAFLRTVTSRLLEAQERLASRTTASIISSLAKAGRRWTGDDAGPERKLAEQLLPAVTGYSPPMIELALDWVGTLLQASALEGLVAREVIPAGALDGPAPRDGHEGLVRAYGPRLVAHVLSGNVPGIPAHSLTMGLLAKSSNLAKVAREEPVFAGLFARSIAAVDPELADLLAVVSWPGGDEAIEQEAFASADAVIVYGGDRAVASIKSRLSPGVRLLEYGHKLSLALVGREVLCTRAREVAQNVARDVSMFDQQGCLSPHVIYVESNHEGARDFAALLAEAMGAFEREIPRGRIGPGEAAAIQAVRARYEFASFEDERFVLHTSPNGTAWTVALDPASTFEASCLNRVVRVKPVADLDRAIRELLPIRRYLQTVGLAVSPSRLSSVAESLGLAGVTRIARLGAMAAPTLGGHHDGRPLMSDLLRFTDVDAMD